MVNFYVFLCKVSCMCICILLIILVLRIFCERFRCIIFSGVILLWWDMLGRDFFCYELDVFKVGGFFYENIKLFKFWV